MRGETKTRVFDTHQQGDFNPLSPCGERQDIYNRDPLEFKISIHSPHAGRDAYGRDPQCLWHVQFQSTLPMRGETTTYSIVLSDYSHFNPLSPCGERRTVYINVNPESRFQSTLPMRGETSFDLHNTNRRFISIHSPHAGRDALKALIRLHYKNFNPLSPCGERPAEVGHKIKKYLQFQSTLPMRGETAKIAKNNDINP